MEITNVKIINASLTMADHGCLTFLITVEGGGIGLILVDTVLGMVILEQKNSNLKVAKVWLL